MTGYGYLPFHAILNSDHRGVFVHIKMKTLKFQQIVHHDSRKLSSRNPASVVRYLDTLRPQVANHMLREKVDRLLEKDLLTEQDIETLQKIDQIYTEMQLSSEAALYTNKSKHDFSTALHELKCLRRYMRRILRLSKFSNTHESLTKLNPAHEVANIQMKRKDILNELGKEK